MEDVVLVTPPIAEPVSLDEVKMHLNITNSDSDNYLSGIVIPGARDFVESETQKSLVTQTWLYKMDGFPGFNPLYESVDYPIIIVPKAPFQEIVSFTYVDVSGITQTLEACSIDGTTPDEQMYGYQIDPGSETQPARLIPPWARPWPPSRRIPAAVQVQFICGYGGPVGSPLVWTGSPIPALLKNALLFLCAHWYDNRWGVMDGSLKEVPLGIERCLNPYRNTIV